MNLEDFKSFRRVLKPSEVGSIPTHSRHLLGIVCALAFAATSPALAQEEVPDDAVTEEKAPERIWIGPSPFERAVRSVAFPAWGQLTNGKNKKAVALFSAQTYIYARLMIETRKGNEANRLADRLEGEGASLGDVNVARSSAADHFSRRRNLFFWAFVAGFYGALDAYVDANFGDIEAELEEGRDLFSSFDPASRTVTLGVHF